MNHHQVQQLTDVLRVDHGTFSVVLVNHVLLGELQVQVGAPLLIPTENRPVYVHARPVVSRLLFLLFVLLSFFRL